MSKIRLVEQPKEKFSWTAELVKLTVYSEPLMVNLKERNTIASLISNKMKDKYPARAFKTQKVTIDNKEYCKVWRTV